MLFRSQTMIRSLTPKFRGECGSYKTGTALLRDRGPGGPVCVPRPDSPTGSSHSLHKGLCSKQGPPTCRSPCCGSWVSPSSQDGRSANDILLHFFPYSLQQPGASLPWQAPAKARMMVPSSNNGHPHTRDSRCTAKRSSGGKLRSLDSCAPLNALHGTTEPLALGHWHTIAL